MINSKYGRLATATEQMLFDLLEEQKETNKLLSQLIPKPTGTVVESKPQVEEKKAPVKTTKRKKKE